ncbi:MAG: helix-turn-helix transcriptional regulator [Bacteroidia bacterium]|nr:helix-turn-helix transcriptional regulator [Bacteroidia bacterium]
MKAISQRSDCPISYALDFFGDKWTFLIIRDMVFDKKRFYKDFLNSKEGIATNILSDRLKRLESIGIVESRVFEQLKTKKEYTLTQKGKDLIPVLVEIILWSAKYDEQLAVKREFVNQAESNRDQVLSVIRTSLN